MTQNNFPPEFIAQIRADIAGSDDETYVDAATLLAALDEIEQLRAALRTAQARNQSAAWLFESCQIWQREAIHAPEDELIERLCQALGYGAVMDAAARLWYRRDPVAAHTTGPCAGMVREWFEGKDTQWKMGSCWEEETAERKPAEERADGKQQ